MSLLTQKVRKRYNMIIINVYNSANDENLENEDEKETE